MTTGFKLARHKSAQATFVALALFYGFFFFAFAIAGFSAMNPDAYGEVAVAGEVEAWAGLQLSGAMLAAIGLLINGRWRWSAALRFIGALIVTLLCLALSASAITAPDGWPIALYCVGFAGLGGLVTWWGLVDLRAAMIWGAPEMETKGLLDGIGTALAQMPPVLAAVVIIVLSISALVYLFRRAGVEAKREKQRAESETMAAVINRLDGVRDMIDGLDSRHDDLSEAVSKIITALEVLKDRGTR